MPCVTGWGDRVSTLHGPEVVARRLEDADVHDSRGGVGPAGQQHDGLDVGRHLGDVLHPGGVKRGVELGLERSRLRAGSQHGEAGGGGRREVTLGSKGSADDDMAAEAVVKEVEDLARKEWGCLPPRRSRGFAAENNLPAAMDEHATVPEWVDERKAREEGMQETTRVAEMRPRALRRETLRAGLVLINGWRSCPAVDQPLYVLSMHRSAGDSPSPTAGSPPSTATQVVRLI